MGCVSVIYAATGIGFVTDPPDNGSLIWTVNGAPALEEEFPDGICPGRYGYVEPLCWLYCVEKFGMFACAQLITPVSQLWNCGSDAGFVGGGPVGSLLFT